MCVYVYKHTALLLPINFFSYKNKKPNTNMMMSHKAAQFYPQPMYRHNIPPKREDIWLPDTTTQDDGRGRVDSKPRKRSQSPLLNHPFGIIPSSPDDESGWWDLEGSWQDDYEASWEASTFMAQPEFTHKNHSQHYQQSWTAWWDMEFSHAGPPAHHDINMDMNMDTDMEMDDWLSAPVNNNDPTSVRGGSCGAPGTNHVRHQSLTDFKTDVSKHDSKHHTPYNYFVEWCWPQKKQAFNKTYPHVYIQWGSDDKFDTSEVIVSALTRDKKATANESGHGISTKIATKPTAATASHQDAVLPMAIRNLRLRSANRKTPHSSQPSSGGFNSTVALQVRSLPSHFETSHGSSRPFPSLQALQASFRLHSKKVAEDHRRSYHLNHERKRRAIVRTSLNDLIDMVPGLKGQGLTKSAMLLKAASWLEELLYGNAQLQAQMMMMGLKYNAAKAST